MKPARLQWPRALSGSRRAALTVVALSVVLGFLVALASADVKPTNVGTAVVVGTNKHLVWNAGADYWDGNDSDAMRFRITASTTPPPEQGFALIPAGSFEMGNALSASGDGSSGELPVHSVSLSAFYMQTDRK